MIYTVAVMNPKKIKRLSAKQLVQVSATSHEACALAIEELRSRLARNPLDASSSDLEIINNLYLQDCLIKCYEFDDLFEGR